MQSTIRRRRSRAKKGVSEIIAAVFMILIIFVAFAVFTVMFNSYVSYTQTANQAAQQIAQNQQTFLSSSMQFGSPVVANGSFNPPAFNLNSIATATVQTHYPTERKVVYSQGFWWAFYSSGTVIVYQSSPDGITWSNPTTLTNVAGSTVSYDFSDWLGSSGILYFVVATHRTVTHFTLGSVPLISGGTIGTVTTATIALAAGYDASSYSSITNDTSGNIWVAINVKHTAGTADSYVEVERCTAALVCTAMDGTAPPTITVAPLTANDIFPQMLRMSGGSMAVVFANAGTAVVGGAFNTVEVLSTVTCNGGAGATQCQGATPAWSASVTTTSTFYPNSPAAVSIGTTVYVSAVNATSIATLSFPLGSATPPEVYTIDASVSGTNAFASMSEDGTGNVLGSGDVLAVYYGSGSNLYFTTSPNDTGWNAVQTVSTSETTIFGLTTLINGTQAGGIFSSGTVSPYTIRFSEVNTQDYNPTQFAPSTVGTSTSPTATGVSSEDKLVYDVGLWWDFYSTGAGIDYATSSDGLTWSAPTVVTAGSGSTSGSDFAVALNGNTLSWVLSSGGAGARFIWGFGTLLSTGTVAFTISGNIATTYTTEIQTSIENDIAGNTWVSLTTLQGGTTYHIEVYEHAAGAPVGTWSSNLAPSTLPPLTATASTIILPSGTSPGAVLIAETSGSIPAGYNAGTGAISIYTTSVTSGWTVSTWTTAVSPPSSYALDGSSAVLVGNSVFFAGLASGSVGSGTGTLNLWSFNIGASSTSAETIMESVTNIWRAAIGSYDNTLFLFDANISSISYYYSANQGYTWSLGAEGTSYEPDVAGLSAADGATIAVTWTNGNVAPYSVRFASLSSLAVTNNSGYAVHLISLFVSQPSTNTLLTYYFTNSTEVFDYWLGPGATASLALTFVWTTNTAYQITIGTSTGVVSSVGVTAPV